MKQIKILSKNAMGKVAICECGVVHINIPGISLHLTDWTFVNLALMMSEASDKLMNAGLKMLCEEEKNKDEQ